MTQTIRPKLLVINGANLNLLGTREPELYGATTLDELETSLISDAAILNYHLECIQSNREYEIIEAIHNAKKENISCIMINPGAFTHTSIAIRDAFLGVNIPFIEIHISNVYTRESFRHHSYLSDIATGVIVGCGLYGYHLALLKAIDLVTNK